MNPCFAFTALIALSLSGLIPAHAEPPKPDEKQSAAAPQKVDPISKKRTINIDGKEISYTATVGKIILKNKKDEPRASVFYTSYVRENAGKVADRPVMFAFNGGPGSSAVWLHLGMLGPRKLNLPGDGTQPITPPARLMDNDQSIIDACDLVFIDPVTTGYSRGEGKTDEKEFHGLKEDVESVGDFIRLWITQNNRWSSPKYLCGESYGGIRAAGLATHLQDRYGMSLNGVILLSSLLDFRTLVETHGSPLSYQVFLPTFATTALHHGKVRGERDALYREAREFAFGEYGLALLKGNEITPEEFDRTANRLSELSGVSADLWKTHQLRMSPNVFRAELLRKEGKVLGRFDSRVAWDSTDRAADSPEYDPSYSLAYQTFSTAMLTYLGDELGWKEDQPYEILTSGVFPWNYGSDNRVVNMSETLLGALHDNPRLRILVMGAHTDLATPPEGVYYSIRQMVGVSPGILKQFSYAEYAAGHMFYTNPPDLKKSRKDLLDFLNLRTSNPISP